MKIKAESLPKRCEICHQSDRFDPKTGFCARCANISTEVGQHPVETRSLREEILDTVFGLSMISGPATFMILCAQYADTVSEQIDQFYGTIWGGFISWIITFGVMILGMVVCLVMGLVVGVILFFHLWKSHGGYVSIHRLDDWKTNHHFFEN